MAFPIIKGRQSLTLSSRQWRYDPETRVSWIEEEYHGSYNAALGGWRQTLGSNKDAMARLEDGTGRLFISIPRNDTDPNSVVRYEILTEFVEKEIWSSPGVIAEALVYNSTVATDEAPLYRKRAEDAAGNFDNGTGIPIGTYPLWWQVVRHLRDGVSGYEREYVVLRRSRRIPRNSSEIASVGDGLSVYSTAQLLLPADVHFSVPDSAAQVSSNAADYFWGWRRRPSTSVIEGIFVEQQSEFILSEWSNLHYTQSGDDAGW